MFFLYFLILFRVLTIYASEHGRVSMIRSLRGVVVKLLALPGLVGSVPVFSSLSDEILNRGPMTIFNDKLLTRGFSVPNVSSPMDLVPRP